MTLKTESQLSDLRLARRAANFDSSAREVLVFRVQDRVRRTVRYVVGASPDLEDFVQTALIEILGSLGNFRGQGSLESWADRITRRTTARMLRQRWRNTETATLDARQEELAARDVPTGLAGLLARTAPDSAASRREIARLVGEVLARIKPKKRTVVVLRWFHGYSPPEIAAITGVPVNTVRDRLQTGMRELRGLIRRDPVLCQWPMFPKR